MRKFNLKTNKIKYIVLFVVFISLFNYSPTTSYACSCVKPGSAEEEMDRSSAVFSGEVIEMVETNQNMFMQSSADPIAVRFEVEEWWKGQAQSEVVVYTAKSSASCGFDFALNQEYLVYAQESDGSLQVSLCSKTAPLASAGNDLDELGVGEKPTEQISLDLKKQGYTTNIIQVFIIFLVIVSLWGGISIIRRSKNKQ